MIVKLMVLLYMTKRKKPFTDKYVERKDTMYNVSKIEYMTPYE